MPAPPVKWTSSADTVTASTSSTSSGGAAIVANATVTNGYARGVEAFADKGHAVHAETTGFGGHGVYGISLDTLGGGIGVYGQSNGATGYGIRAYQTGSKGYGVYVQQTGTQGYGVYATQAGSEGRAVYGYASHTRCSNTLCAAGVYGKSRSEYSVGVYGTNSAVRGDAVVGEATATGGIGVRGHVHPYGRYGVYAIASVSNAAGTGVQGYAMVTNGTATAVEGNAWGSRCIGVKGVVNTFGSNDYAVFASGRFGGTSAKYFVQPHPTDPALCVQFICLEGNESGTYFRGKTKLTDGRAEIPIPEEWALVTEAEGITVQVTPYQPGADLYVAEASRERIVVKGVKDCAFTYLVNGVRRGFSRYEPYIPNTAFQPEVKGVPFGTQYPNALRDVLVKNGVLNADYTPNEATASRLGWDLKEQSEVPVNERWWLRLGERGRSSRPESTPVAESCQAPSSESANPERKPRP